MKRDAAGVGDGMLQKWAPGRGSKPPRPDSAGLASRNIIPYHALPWTKPCRKAFTSRANRGRHATKQHGQIVETPTEARGAEPGPSVLALLTVAPGSRC